MDQTAADGPAQHGTAETASTELDDLIPRWLFCVRAPVAQALVAVLVPLAFAVPMLVASDPSDLRFGPLLAVAAIVVAATTSWRASALAGALIVAGYWCWGVPPSPSFRLTSVGNAAAVVAMAILTVGLALLTRRIEVTVAQVRQLDTGRQQDLDRARALAAQLAEVHRTGGLLGDCGSRAEVADALLGSVTLPSAPTTASVAVVDGTHLRVLASRGSSPDLIQMLESVDITQSSWLGEVLAGRPVFVADRDRFAAEHPNARALHLYPAGSWLVLPFRTEGSIGMLSLHWLTPQPLGDFEGYFFLLAELLATSLARTSAEEARRRELQDLQHSFAERDRIARTLSTSLIPTVLPELPGFGTAHWLEPASADEVAGDFYDLFTVGAHDWIAVLGDVCGKGAEAAAVASLARYAARTAALSTTDPLRVVELVDRALTADSSDLFCTLAVVRWYSGSQEISVALAGHHPARVLTDHGVHRVGTFGSAAGFGLGRFDAARAPFREGDTLVLFSDGLTERDPAFGDEELDRLLAKAPRSAESLLDEVQAHVGRLRAVRADDIAVLVVSRDPHQDPPSDNR